MIDLSVAIRSHILNDEIIAPLLPNYQGSEPIFTRRPVPTDAPYPLVLVSSLVSDNPLDYLSCQRRILTYDIATYGKNDTPANYRTVEQIANRIQAIFHRMPKYALNMPTGSSLIRVSATGPIIAPVDTNDTVGRVVICNFEVSL